MRIIACRGSNSLLIEIGSDPSKAGRILGQVLNIKTKTLYPPMNIESILARGYWEEYTGSQDILPDLLVQSHSPEQQQTQHAPDRTKEAIHQWLLDNGFHPTPLHEQSAPEESGTDSVP